MMHNDDFGLDDNNSLSCAIRPAYYSAGKDCRLIREMPTGRGFAAGRIRRGESLVGINYDRDNPGKSHSRVIEKLDVAH